MSSACRCAILFDMEYQLIVKSALGDDEEALIPDGVAEIGANAFRGKRALRRVVLPASCTAIGDYAFDGCRNLEEIILPDGCSSIGAFAFKNCSSLERIALPQALQTVPKQAFARCAKLTAVEGLEHVRTIDIDAFTGCAALEEADASSAIGIGDRAFSGCRALGRIVLGDELRRIGHYAFRSCIGLRAVALPGSVTDLGTNIFSGCHDIDVQASEATVRAHPDAFPRSITLAYGIIRQQDVRDLSAQFRRNHAADSAELQARHAQLTTRATQLRNEISSLGVMDLKKRDVTIAELESIDAELEDIDALLAEIERPGMQSLIEEFATPHA